LPCATLSGDPKALPLNHGLAKHLPDGPDNLPGQFAPNSPEAKKKTTGPKTSSSREEIPLRISGRLGLFSM